MVATMDETRLWHQRFGHYNLNSPKLMHQKKMIADLPLLENETPVCEGFMVGKQHKHPLTYSS